MGRQSRKQREQRQGSTTASKQTQTCEIPVIDVAEQCIIATAGTPEARDRLQVLIVRPDATFYACTQCGEVLGCCLLCRTIGHYATREYWQRGAAFVLCSECAMHLIACDQDSRTGVLNLATTDELRLRDFCNGEDANGPWRWDYNLPAQSCG